MDLIKEAKVRGYRKGIAIIYLDNCIDYVEGNYFEIKNKCVVAYKKPKDKRICFDDFRYDTLFDGNEWVKIKNN
jgi:hypothetical protein